MVFYMINNLFNNFSWFEILTFFVLLGFLIMLICDLYILKPFYTYVSNKADKPFYDGKIAPLFAFKNGKYMYIHNILLTLVFCFISFVIPELLFPGKNYILGTILIIIMLLPCFIIKGRGNIFHDPEIIQVSDNYTKLVNFKDGGYSSSYYILLTIFNMMFCFVFGVLAYIMLNNFKYFLVIVFCLIFEVMIIFVDFTDKIMPFNMQKESGFWIFTLIVALSIFYIAFRL